jgi:hypothetical protein
MELAVPSYFPSDALPVRELSRVGEEETRALEFGCDDVATHLLKQPFDKFCNNLASDQSIRAYLDSFIRFAPRPSEALALETSIEYDHASVEDERQIATHLLLFRRVFNVFRRLVDFKEIDQVVATGRFKDRGDYGMFLYRNWVVNAVQMLDFMSLYAFGDLLPECKRILENLFELQPSYVVDLSDAILSVSSVLLQLTERIKDAIKRSSGNSNQGEVADWTAYLVDIMNTLWSARRTCPDVFSELMVRDNFLAYFNTIVRTISPALTSWGGKREDVDLVTAMCVAFGADEPLKAMPSKLSMDDKKAIASVDANFRRRDVRRKNSDEKLESAYRAILEKYGDVEDDEDEYIGGTFSTEKDGPEIIKTEEVGGVGVAIVRDLDGKEVEVLLPNQNRTIAAPRSTKRLSGRGRGRGRGRGKSRGGGTARGGNSSATRGKGHQSKARGGKVKSNGGRGRGHGRK